MVRKVMNPTVSRNPTASCVPSVTYMANGRRLDQSARGFLQRSGFQLTDQRSHRGKRRVELPLTFEEFTMDEAVVRPHPEPWNKGKLVGQKAPFKLKEIWAIRVRLQLFRRVRDLALFDLGSIRAEVAGWPCPLSPSYAQSPIHARFLQPRR
jgi:hypothetical protein